MSQDATEIRRVVERFAAITQSGRLDELDEILSPEVYDHVGKRAGIPWWKEIMGMVRAGFGDAETTVHHILVDGDTAAVHFTVTGKQTGRFLPQIGPVEPSGAPVSWTHVHLFRFAEGLIVEHWAVRDDLGLAIQAGVVRP